VGDAPTLRPFGELIENFDSIRVPVKEADRKKGPYPYYGASGIVDYVDSYLFDGDYLLVAEDGENLRTHQTPIAFMASGKFWVNNHAHIVTGNAENDTRYLMYALRIADVRAYLTGSTMPKLTQGNMVRVPVLHWPLPTQRAIAGVLGALDDKIEVNRRMARTLEAAARALFESWFVRFEHPGGKAPAPRLVDSPMGPIPEGWSVRPIGDLVEAVGGGTPSTKDASFWTDGLYPFCTPKDMSGIAEAVILSTERKVTEAGLAQISSGLLPIGTVIMSSRAPIGYLGIAEIPLTVNQGIIAMKCTKGVPPVWVLRWCDVNMDRIKAAANGSTFMEISKHHFRPIGAIVPPLGLLAEYERVAEPMYRRVVNIVQENQNLATLRDLLLPKLISGELEIADATAIVKGGA